MPKDKLEGLKPDFRKKVEAVLADMRGHGWHAYVAEGKRTWEQQKEKVRKGYSKTMHSKHLDGDGADVVDDRYLWSDECPKLYWLHQASSAISHGLRSGAFFGLNPHEETELRLALKAGDFDKAAKLKLGWDPAHMEMVR